MSEASVSLETLNKGREAYESGEPRDPNQCFHWRKGWDLAAQATALKLKNNQVIIDQKSNILDVATGLLRWARKIQTSKTIKISAKERLDLLSLAVKAGDIEEVFGNG